MTESVFAALALAGLAEQLGPAVLVVYERGVALGGDGSTVDLPLLSGVGVEVLVLHLEHGLAC